MKHAVDWSLFYLAYVFYRERFASLRWMNWWVYFSVAMFMASVFVAQLFLPAMARENHSVIIPFVAMQVLFPLRILPFVLMLIGCFFDKREKPLGRYVSCVVVLCIAYFQISDIALSWGLRTGSYYVRFFPVLLGIFYASKVFEIYDEEMAENAKDGENAKGYRRIGMQAAHDLKSPVLALRHQFRKLNLAKKEADTVLSSLDTIAGITQSLEKDFQHKKELFLSTKLSDLCASVISEKKIEFKDKETLRLIYSCEKDA